MVKQVLSALWKTVFVLTVILFVGAYFFEPVYELAERRVALPARTLYAAVLNGVPLPVFEVGAASLLLAIPFVIWRYIKGKGSLGVLTLALELFVFGYIITVGVPSARPSQSEGGEASESDVLAAAELIGERLCGAADALGDGEEVDFSVLRRAVAEYAEATLSVSAAHTPRIKSTLSPALLSRLDILAYYSPATAEIISDPEQPSFMQAQSAAHELFHFFGVMREDEATYAAFAALSHSSDPYLYYAAYLSAFVSVGARLYKQSPDDYCIILDLLPPRVKKDLTERQTFVDKSADAAVSATLNDAALCLYDARGGGSYSRAADLIIKALLSP